LDYDTPLKLASPDCESDNPPPIGTVHGPAAIRGVLEPFFAAAHENEFKILRKARTDGSSCR
jgi:limonene-1,2-epoxide hydrolase